MPVFRKKYELLGMDYCMMSFTYLRLEVKGVEFKNGNAANGVPASYSTDNEFIQDAIENDRRFKAGRIKLVSSVLISDEGPKPQAKKQEAEAEPQQPRRVQRPKSPFISKEEVKVEAPSTEEAYEMVKSVKSVNDAVAYFAEKGEQFSSDEELAALKDKYKVAFPNLK